MSLLKENWFKIALVVLLAIYIALNRFSFFHIEGTLNARCDRLTGVCIRVRLDGNRLSDYLR